MKNIEKKDDTRALQDKTNVNNKNIEKRLPKFNLYLIAASLVIVIIGLVIMYVGPDSEAQYEPDIFSFRRIVVAPVIIFIGFISTIFAILCPKLKH